MLPNSRLLSDACESGLLRRAFFSAPKPEREACAQENYCLTWKSCPP